MKIEMRCNVVQLNTYNRERWNFEGGQDPDQDPDPHQSDKSNPDPDPN